MYLTPQNAITETPALTEQLSRDVQGWLVYFFIFFCKGKSLFFTKEKKDISMKFHGTMHHTISNACKKNMNNNINNIYI